MELDLQELFQVYVVEAEECIASLEEGLLELEQRPDDIPLIDEIFRAAHTLKSSSASLGALTLATLCKELEALSLTEHVSSAVEMLPVIEAEYQVVQAALSTELRRSE